MPCEIQRPRLTSGSRIEVPIPNWLPDLGYDRSLVVNVFFIFGFSLVFDFISWTVIYYRDESLYNQSQQDRNG